MSDVGLGPLVRWLDRCQAFVSRASAFLATRPCADLDALAADLDALTAGLPAFCAQVRPGVVLLLSTDTRAAVRGLGTLVHYLRRYAEVNVDESLAGLFLSGKDRARVEPLADQLRGLRLALRAFRDLFAGARAHLTRPGSGARPVRPVCDIPDTAAHVAAPRDVVVLGVLASAAVVAPDRVDPMLVDLDALTAGDRGRGFCRLPNTASPNTSTDRRPNRSGRRAPWLT